MSLWQFVRNHEGSQAKLSPLFLGKNPIRLTDMKILKKPQVVHFETVKHSKCQIEEL